MQTDDPSAFPARRSYLLPLLIAVLALAFGAGIGYHLATRIADKDPQPIIDAIDRTFPAPPGANKVDEHFFSAYVGGHPSGKQLYDFDLDKGVLIDADKMDNDAIRACINFYVDYVAEAFGRSGVQFGSTGGVNLRGVSIGFHAGSDKPEVEQAFPRTWRESAGKWFIDGSSIEVTGELYDIANHEDGQEVLSIIPPGNPRRGRRVLAIQIIVHGRGFTQRGHWSFEHNSKPNH